MGDEGLGDERRYHRGLIVPHPDRGAAESNLFWLEQLVLRAAQDSDFVFLRGFSSGPRDERIRAQIRDGRLLIIESLEVPVGFIKFYVLWEVLPFMEVIVIREDYRGCGIGRRAVREWEEQMAAKSFKITIVSTQADETAKDFWHRVGYHDCGSLTLPGRAIELFMYRDISTAVDLTNRCNRQED